MEEEKLGPNGGMLFAMEYLEKNIDWLEEEMGKIIEKEDKRQKGSTYFVIDTPGQVELWTNHGSLKRIVERFTKKDFRVRSLPSCYIFASFLLVYPFFLSIFSLFVVFLFASQIGLVFCLL